MGDSNQGALRAALGWETDDYDKAKDAATNPVVWLWEVLQGDFNEDASVAQSLTAAGIGALPLVGQICTIRDLIADCRRLIFDPKKTWYWVALAMTLITLFPSLGALFKGVLRIIFSGVRRSGGELVIKEIDVAITWVVSYLRRRYVQEYIEKVVKVDEIFGWLASQVRALKSAVTVKAMSDAFDAAIRLVEGLGEKVRTIPVIGDRAATILVEMKRMREKADENLAMALKPVQDILDRIAQRLEHEVMQSRSGIVNANNVHFRGDLPESTALRLMRKKRPLPSWLSEGGNIDWKPAKYADYTLEIEKKVKAAWPRPSVRTVESFHTMVADEIRGPARLYRVISPQSRAMSDCWVSETIFNKLQSSADPRAAWRRYLAVWPDWNVNGQFVIYDIKRGESLKVWRGPTSSQFRETELPDRHLEGGGEQIVFNVERSSPHNDTMAYYKVDNAEGHQMRDGIDKSTYDKLSDGEKTAYKEVRKEINHPNISGPFETGWGYIDFDGLGFWGKVGVPDLPGQITTSRE